MFGGRLKFQLNKYTFGFLFFNIIFSVLSIAVLDICSAIFEINRLFIFVCIALIYILIVGVTVIEVKNSKYFNSLRFNQNKTKSIALYIENLDKIKSYILNNKYNKYTSNYNNHYFNTSKYYEINSYKKHISYMKEGNEFWIILSAIKANNDIMVRHKDTINKLLDIDNVLYLHRRYILEDMNRIMKLRRDELFNQENKTELEELEKTIDTLYDAINLNDSFYKVDKSIAHKEMLENLFDSWVLMAILYMIDTNELLNQDLIDSLEEIMKSFSNNLVEFNKERDILKEENKMLQEIWAKQSKQFLELTKLISKDFKR